MKQKIILTIGLFHLCLHGWGQQNPTPYATPFANTPAQAVTTANAAWYRGGNSPTGPAGNSNIFGTNIGFNSPIYTVTNGVNRTRLSGDLVVNALGANVNMSGHFGIGLNGYFNNAANMPLTMLHLEGGNNTPFNNHFGGQYRSWMRVGTLMRENSDAMYVGLKPEGGSNRSDAVVYWSDDTGTDKLRFLMGSSLLALPGGVNPLNGQSQNGYEFMRMHNSGPLNQSGYSAGYIGIGPLFTDALPPQNRMHMNAESGLPTYLQVSNIAGGGTPGTGQTALDGLKLGVERVGTQTYQTGFLQWQENSPFIVQTDWDGAPGGINNGERMRITTIGAPGVIDPVPAPTQNITRVAISHRGDQPITNPRSLLHLGYNTSTALIGGGQNDDGWRDWMDVGTFTNVNSDNMYVGMKREGNDRYDAVVNWGDNQAPTLTGENGPDNLRFIFTSTTTALTGIGDSISRSNNGLETGRFYPGYDTTFTYLLADSLDLYGRFGVGDFTASGVDENPTHKLDVIGNGRFRYLPDSLYIADSLTTKYVMVDSMGVLRWTSAGPSFGTTCEDTVGGKLTFDTKVDLNNYNLYFTNNDSISKNRVGIGYECGDSLKSKLNVYSEDEQWAMDIYSNGANPVDINSQGGLKVFVDSIETDLSIGILGEVATNNSGNILFEAYGVYGKVDATNFKLPAAVKGQSVNGGTGGWFESQGVDNNIATNSIRAMAYGSNSSNTGAYIYASSGSTNAAGGNIGVYSNAEGASENGNIAVRAIAGGSLNGNVGVYSTAVGANNYAGYFQGNVVVTNGTLTGSDLNLKENINDLDSALQIISSLHPVKYQFKQTGDAGELSLPTEQQQGLIAQEVETILPDFVKEVEHPVSIDEEGNVLYPSFSYKTLDYEKFVPLLIAGMKEQQVQISNLETENGTVTSYNDSLENVVSDLNDRLTNLENCLSNILQGLCNANQQAVSQTTEEIQEQLRSIIDVELSDKNSIVLNQNVPNPFAERTVISYSVPLSVQRAQIHFYDMNGVLINSVDITERGEGQINVYANDLSSGIYTYSLVADGKVVSTKKMMKN